MNEHVFNKINKYFGNFVFRLYDPAANGGKGGAWELPGQVATLPHLRAQNARGRHVWLRPDDEGRFMLHDDADLGDLIRFHGAVLDGDRIVRAKPGRLIVETSPGNFQVWVKSKRPLTVAEKLGWLRIFGSDPGAAPRNRSGRAPGFRTRWPRHDDGTGHFPLARLVWVQWSAVDVPPPPAQLVTDTSAWSVSADSSGLASSTGSTCRPGRTALDRMPRRSDYVCGRGRDQSPSSVDFRYALALLRRGVPAEEVQKRLLDEREDFGSHTDPDSYVETTVTNAQHLISASA